MGSRGIAQLTWRARRNLPLRRRSIQPSRISRPISHVDRASGLARKALIWKANVKYSVYLFSGLAMLGGCQAQPKPAASATMPTVLNVTAQPRQHQPSVDAMPAAVPASSSASAKSSSIPAYLPPEGSTTSAPPVGLVPAPRAQVTRTEPSHATMSRARKAGGKTYFVRRGDTLFQIAREQCGSGAKWRQIAALNPGLTPANLKAGQKLLMP